MSRFQARKKSNRTIKSIGGGKPFQRHHLTKSFSAANLPALGAKRILVSDKQFVR
jgi:hypothetical protein